MPVDTNESIARRFIADVWNFGDLTVAEALRRDLEVADISLVFEQLAAIDVGDAVRFNQLRHRYLASFLTALRDASSSLPGLPPTWEEIRSRWATWLLARNASPQKSHPRHNPSWPRPAISTIAVVRCQCWPVRWK